MKKPVLPKNKRQLFKVEANNANVYADENDGRGGFYDQLPTEAKTIYSKIFKNLKTIHEESSFDDAKKAILEIADLQIKLLECIQKKYPFLSYISFPQIYNIGLFSCNVISGESQKDIKKKQKTYEKQMVLYNKYLKTEKVKQDFAEGKVVDFSHPPKRKYL
jgi:hypothetical protein